MFSETTRLRYEPLREHHAAELRYALCDPRVYTFIGPCPTPDGLRTSFARKEAGAPAEYSHERWLHYAVRLIETCEAIGRLEATVIGQRAEVAFLLGPAFWDRGYASEGLVWLHELLSGSFGVTEFWATVTPGNTRSIRLLQRTGYREAPADTWPQLGSYNPGDHVFSYSMNP